MPSKRTPAAQIALGGVLAALAVVLMCMGTLIPVATYVCPMLCAILLQLVLKTCGKRIAWAWYGAVTILSLLMAPDKEAAAVFLALGYYPIVKPKLDSKKGKWLWKGLLFNSVILLTYWLLMHLFGFDALAAEFSEMGILLVVLMLLLGNVTFFCWTNCWKQDSGNDKGRALCPPFPTKREMNMESIWYLYILRCKDGTFYTGITTDVEKRLEAHRTGRGAKYTRGRAPLELVYRETCGSHSDALKREWQIKGLSREDKQKLIENPGETGDCAGNAKTP